MSEEDQQRRARLASAARRREVNHPDEGGRTPLWRAAFAGHLDVVLRLLEAGANPNAANMDGETPLWRAACNGHAAVVQSLLVCGANPNATQKGGETCLWRAACNGHGAVVQLLLGCGADPNATAKGGETPLWRAARNGHADALQQLLAANVDPNATDKYGDTPLWAAACGGHGGVVQLLLASRADPNLANRTGAFALWRTGGVTDALQQLLFDCTDPDAADEEGDTPLFAAAEHGHAGVVQQLLAAGADPNAVDEDNATPLRRAATEGRVAVVQQLLAAGADPTIESSDGQTPLWRAASHGHADVVQQLLAAGADPNAADEENATPLRRAATHGHVAVVQQLLAAGADPTIESSDGQTPLWLAACYGHADVVLQLLVAGADPNAANEDGRTPLFQLAGSGHAEGVRRLLSAGADPNAANKDDRTPIFAAADNGDAEVVRLLLAASADPNAADKYGETPFRRATCKCHTEVLRLLLAAGARSERSDKEVPSHPGVATTEPPRTDHVETAAQLQPGTTVGIFSPNDVATAVDCATVQRPVATHAAAAEDRRVAAIALARVDSFGGDPAVGAAMRLNAVALCDAATAMTTFDQSDVGDSDDAEAPWWSHATALRQWADANRRFAGEAGYQLADKAADTLKDCVTSRRLAQRRFRDAKIKAAAATGKLQNALEDNAGVTAAQRSVCNADKVVRSTKSECQAAGTAYWKALENADEVHRFFRGHRALRDTLHDARSFGSAADKLMKEADDKAQRAAAPLLKALRPAVQADVDYRDEGPVDESKKCVRRATRLCDGVRVVLRAYDLGLADERCRAREAGIRAVRAFKRLAPTQPPSAAVTAAEAASLVVLPTALFVSSVRWSETEFTALFLEMPYLPGGSLKARLDDRDAGDEFTMMDVALLMSRLALAVSLLHRAGVAHGDLTESNVVFWDAPRQPDGWRPALIDFTDTAALDRTRTMTMGTPEALPPEVILAGGCDVTPELDCWQLGRLVKKVREWAVPPVADDFLAARMVDILDRVAAGLQSEMPGRMTAEHAAEQLSTAAAAANALVTQMEETERDMAEALRARDVAVAIYSPPPYWTTADGQVVSGFALGLGERVGLSVTRAVRVQNRGLWQRYAADRADVGATTCDSTVPESLDGVGAWGVAALVVNSTLALPGVGLPDASPVSPDQARRARANRDLFPEPAANEALLFHGTDAGTAQLIAAGGFDPSRSGDNVGALFGAATCFTPDPAKAQQYAGPGGVVIVARVILGEVFDVGVADHETAQLRRAQIPGSKEFHSIVGFNRNAGAVLCVYRHNRAYPELLLSLA